jgi:hypothetical protein
MEDNRSGQARVAAGTDDTLVAADDWRDADDPFGDEAAFPSIWQQLDCTENVPRD